MTTAHDEFVIKSNKNELLEFYQDFQKTERDEALLHKKFKVLKKDGWNILNGYDNIQGKSDLSIYIKPLTYRPFDNRYIFYEDKLVWRTVKKVMQHFIKGDNIGLVIGRQGQVVGSMPWNLSFITNSITDFNLYYRGGGMLFPLYLYPDSKGQQTTEETAHRKPNLNPEIVKHIAKKLGLEYVWEKDLSRAGTFAPIDIMDYIYAVLHSPSYREKYKEFLKIDFPRVPYPKDQSTFWELVKLGGELRQIHLLESAVVERYITQYPEDGDNVVGKIRFENGNVWINGTQYFANVPEVAWNFYIGGYQPAQKWLKDRKERKLEFEDILHYQKIIVALSETARVMKEIDGIEVE
jgi:predicted helicase